LAGKHIKAGTGKPRAANLRRAKLNRATFKKIGVGLGVGLALTVASPVILAAGAVAVGAAAVALPISLIPAAIHNNILVPRAERKFCSDHSEMLEVLEKNQHLGVLQSEKVRAKLVQHKTDNGQKITEQEMFRWVRIGERIAKGLQAEGGDEQPLEVYLEDVVDEHGRMRTFTIEPDAYFARCVSWYMMAQAAAQDVAREASGDSSGTSDMVTDGSFVMKDPGNRMYKFLASSPTCAARTSTHFAERLAHNVKHKLLGWIPTKKWSQRGIEDFQSQLPGKGGAMLFDKIVPVKAAVAERRDVPDEQLLFVKFEASGCPAYYQAGSSLFHSSAALLRNVAHGFSFAGSRGVKGAKKGAAVQRQEHVYKGVLKPIADRFDLLVADAIKNGVIEADAKAVGESVREFGMEYVMDAIWAISEMALKQNNRPVALECELLMGAIGAEYSGLDRGFRAAHPQSELISPRGAEAHIAL
jgi:hypothetical protein